MKRCPFCETTYADHHTTCGNEGCEGHGSRLIKSRQLEPGTLIGKKYRIVGFIGRGGMGTVYLAEHIHLKERHALKFISADLTENPKVLNRFQLEAQTLRRLTDPNIVTIYDLDQADDGAFYIAMEFVDGLSLSEIISAGPLPVERALAIARGVASGLAAAHAKGIVHRDVKPDNILLDHSALHTTGIETPKLLDFGIAAVKETSNAMSRTRGLMLTPEYAAPEQWAGMSADQIDGRTDLYALGGVLHEMLTGTTCLNSPTPDGWMYQHLHSTPTALSQRRPDLAQWPGLDALVVSLLSKERGHRPASAPEVIEKLRQLKRGLYEVSDPKNIPVTVDNLLDIYKFEARYEMQSGKSQLMGEARAQRPLPNPIQRSKRSQTKLDFVIVILAVAAVAWMFFSLFIGAYVYDVFKLPYYFSVFLGVLLAAAGMVLITRIGVVVSRYFNN